MDKCVGSGKETEEDDEGLRNDFPGTVKDELEIENVQRADDNALRDLESIRSNSSNGHENRHGGAEISPQELESQVAVSINDVPHSIFTKNQKRYIVFMVALAGFFSPMSANIYFPVLNTLAKDFNVSIANINLTVTTYMIFQGLAPTIFGDLADMAGRRPVYLIGFTIYIGANIGIACCQDYASLLVLRCLQSSGSSGTIALASGVVADISTSSERGVWMGWALAGPMAAPAIAPVLGGVLALASWRWIFWFLVITACSYLLLFAITFPETGRNIVGNGYVRPKGWNLSVLNYLQARRVARAAQIDTISQHSLVEKRRLRAPNPLKSLRLFAEKDVALLLLFNGMMCCAAYDIMVALPHLLEEIYGYDALRIGLCFLPFGAGSFAAPYLSGRLMDWNFQRVAKKIGFEIRKGRAEDLRNFPLERTRVTVVLPLILLCTACVLCFGWVMYLETSLAAPLVLVFFIGLTTTGTFNVMSSMLVDLYPESPATASAANNLARCLLGAGATAVIQYMLDSMGRGWCFTLIAAVLLGLTPALWVLQRFGPKWREERRLRTERQRLRKAKRGQSDVERAEPVETDTKDFDPEKSEIF